MRIKILLALLLLPSLSYAAVDCADANAVASEFGTPSSPMTASYTRPSGSDFVGFVLAGQRQGAGARTVSAIDWGGSTPTSITTAQYTDPAGGELFRLITPPSGSQTVSVTWSAGRLADGIVVFVCTGAHQTTPTHDPTQSTGTGTTASVTVSNVTASDVVIFCVAKDGNEAMTGGGSLTLIKTASAPAEMNVGCWSQPGSAGGSGSITWTGSQQWTIQAAAVQPPASTDLGGEAIWFP